MKATNPMTSTFLIKYPGESARVFEKLSKNNVQVLLDELPVTTVAPVIAAMLQDKATDILTRLSKEQAAKIVAQLPIPSIARIYQLLDAANQANITALLSDKQNRLLMRFITYPATSAGSLIDPNATLLTENMTVADALRRIEHAEQTIMCDIFIVNDTHKLVGMIELSKLIASDHHSRLQNIMHRKTQAISVHTKIETLGRHPGWTNKRYLPIIDRDKSFVGILHYRVLQDATGATGTTIKPDPLNNVFSLISLYWLSLAQLLDSLFSYRKLKRRKR